MPVNPKRPSPSQDVRDAGSEPAPLGRGLEDVSHLFLSGLPPAADARPEPALAAAPKIEAVLGTRPGLVLLRPSNAAPSRDQITAILREFGSTLWEPLRAIATQVSCSRAGQIDLLAADRSNRLVIVDIAPKDYFWVGHRAEFTAMNELNLEHLASRAEAELRFEARVDDWAMRKFLTTNLERGEDARWRWSINLPALTQALPLLEKNSLQPDDRFEGPALFVVGERSNYVSNADHAAIRNHFPAAIISTIPKAGHNPHMDQREAFVRAVLENRP